MPQKRGKNVEISNIMEEGKYVRSTIREDENKGDKGSRTA
jgi:hypothetical protein